MMRTDKEMAMELQKVIENRRSIRRFKDDALPDGTIEALLEAARLAPSGTNLQPWRFLAVTSPEMRDKLAECTFHVNFIRQAPLVMVCCADLTAGDTRGVRVNELREAGAFAGTDLDKVPTEGYVQKAQRDPAAEIAYLSLNVAIAVEHMILRGVELGLGSCWVMLCSQRKVRELLNLPENLHVTALVPFGYPGQEPAPRPRQPLEAIYLGEV
jgi:nitroreductase